MASTPATTPTDRTRAVVFDHTDEDGDGLQVLYCDDPGGAVPAVMVTFERGPDSGPEDMTSVYLDDMADVRRLRDALDRVLAAGGAR